jgi:dsDNA-specific endonuclease/ATPase MutS2
MNDYQLMQIWRGIKYPQKEVEQKVLEYGHRVYEQAYRAAREEMSHYFYPIMDKRQELKPVLQQALSALDSAYYILRIQPVTPEQEADTIAIAIQSVTETLEKMK